MKYKTLEELKEELGDKFEEYMYKANIELLEKIDIGGFCELKKKCDEGLCDCTNEEYNSMAECNMRISLENDALQQENKQLKEIVENLTTMTVCGDRKQIKNTAQYKLELAEQRIDKAIKYIKSNIDNTGWLEIGSNCVKELLEILGGKENE